jgi:hypothetical protein
MLVLVNINSAKSLCCLVVWFAEVRFTYGIRTSFGSPAMWRALDYIHALPRSPYRDVAHNSVDSVECSGRRRTSSGAKLDDCVKIPIATSGPNLNLLLAHILPLPNNLVSYDADLASLVFLL